MVKPIHLQDNFGKTLIAQRMADEGHIGAEKLKQVQHEAFLLKLEKHQHGQAQGLEEHKKLKEFDSQEQKRNLLQKKEKRDKDEEEEGGAASEESLNDLRLRKEEDDRGKGGMLDLKG